MLLKPTTSLCPTCLAQVPATVEQRGGGVFLRKTCPDHGTFEAQISSDANYYHLSIGRTEPEAQVPSSSACCSTGCCGPAPIREAAAGAALPHDPTIVETASTCIGLIEIVRSCNLACPTCFADSPKTLEVDAVPLAEVKSRIEAVIARKGMVDILQLSGGEPTLHPDFFALLDWALAHPKIGYCLLNTNGVRFAQEADFASRVGEIRRARRKLEVYLQFDGPQEAGQVQLRGLDLRRLRERVIARCGEENIPVTLAMTVTGDNVEHLGDTLRLALSNRIVRGITFQPMFGSGRAQAGVNLTVGGKAEIPSGIQRPPVERLSVADIVKRLVTQGEGLLAEKDFTPLPCGDPNCHTVGYLVRKGDRLWGLSHVIDLPGVQGFLQNRANFSIADLEKCGCENEELGHLLKALEVGPDDVLRLFIKPFMDAWTYDQHRIDRCCVHVIGEGGSLESFCRHYAMR